TSEGRMIRDTEAALTVSIGGNPTPQKAAICRTVAISLWRLSSFERLMAEEQRKAQPDYDRIERWDSEYRRWSNHAREGLRLIGLERVAAPVPSLQEYLAEFDRKAASAMKEAPRATSQQINVSTEQGEE